MTDENRNTEEMAEAAETMSEVAASEALDEVARDMAAGTVDDTPAS